MSYWDSSALVNLYVLGAGYCRVTQKDQDILKQPFGRPAVEIQFIDNDGRTVIASLSLDKEGSHLNWIFGKQIPVHSFEFPWELD
jgi:hypothetical protein